jgi:hypothetical protein
MILVHLPLSLDASRTIFSSFVWWRARRWRVASTICRLGSLKLNTVLLAVVTAIRASAAVVTVVVVCGGRVRRCRLLLVAVVGCGGLVVVVVGAWARGPTCAVEGLATSFAAATSRQATESVLDHVAMKLVMRSCIEVEDLRA